MVRAGWPRVEVVRVSQAGFVAASFSWTKRKQAVLVTAVTPAARGRATGRAKVVWRVAPARRLPKARVQAAPAGTAAGTQVQPGELAAAAKVVWAGTVSTAKTAPAP